MCEMLGVPEPLGAAMVSPAEDGGRGALGMVLQGGGTRGGAASGEKCSLRESGRHSAAARVDSWTETRLLAVDALYRHALIVF